MSRRNSRGEELPPAQFYDRSYDERQMASGDRSMRVLRPLVMECGDCGTKLRIATWWTAFRCGVCGRMTDENGELSSRK